MSAVAAPPVEPLPAPFYSFDLQSPSLATAGIEASAVLQLAFPTPGPVLAGSSLRLFSTKDDLDALSGAHLEFAAADTPFAILFSVDRRTGGAVGPDEDLIGWGVPFNAMDQATRGHAAGDQFIATDRYTSEGVFAEADQPTRRNNFLTRNNFDEGGTDFGAMPATHGDSTGVGNELEDRVDAMAWLEVTASGVGVERAYFSVAAGAPSLLGLPGPASGASIFVAVATTPNAGACCLQNLGCEWLDQKSCFVEGGVWFGPGASCNLCEGLFPEGACCVGPAGECFMVTAEGCAAEGGEFYPGVPCAQSACGSPPEGACCFADGAGGCVVTSEFACFSEGGVFFPGVACEDAACGGPAGACCLNTAGGCAPTTPEMCAAQGGAFFPNFTCNNAPCGGGDPTGACCREGSGCTETTPSECAAAGGIFEPGVPCGPQTCDPAVGACCIADGACDVLPEFICDMIGGAFAGDATDCQACAPEDIGTCCIQGGCIMTSSAECDAPGGLWLGPAVHCEVCSAFESEVFCCLPDGQCVQMIEMVCITNGGMVVPGSCRDCPFFAPLVGACCFAGDACQQLDEMSCLEAQGVWWGPGVPCEICPPELPDAGGCCLPDACETTDPVTCVLAGGAWIGPDVPCDLCALASACCLPDGTCEETDVYLCSIAGGAWTPNTTCASCSPAFEMSVSLYASPSALGLVPGDDIDALVVIDANDNGVFDTPDRVIFSLAPGSPSLSTVAGAAANILVVEFGAAPVILASANDLGLGLADDNVDALEIHPGEVRISAAIKYGIRGEVDGEE